MDLNLTDSESRYYNDLFTLCDVDSNGKIQYLKALEFFRSSNADNSVLAQVSCRADNKIDACRERVDGVAGKHLHCDRRKL